MFHEAAVVFPSCPPCSYGERRGHLAGGRSRPEGAIVRFSGLFLLIAALVCSVAVGREIVPADTDWRFHLGDAAGAQEPPFDDSGWAVLDLPHDWSIGLPKDHAAASKGDGGFFPGGVGWYRRTFTVPASWKDQLVAIEFDGVYRAAEVWINGVRVGHHPYGYSRFRFDLTPHMRTGGENVLAVRVDNSAQPNSRWYSGSGIYRHVRLIAVRPVHTEHDSVFVRVTDLSEDAALLQVDRSIRNASDRDVTATVEARFYDPTLKPVADASTTVAVPAGATVPVPTSVRISDPHPWSPETPEIYQAVTRVRVDGKVVDEVTVPFGIRTVRVSPERGFELNGRPLKLVGANVHHDNGPLGAAAFDRAEERRVQILKDAGFNAIRTAHNPPSPAFLAACDRLGVLVMDESFDGWEKTKTKHDYGTTFNEWWQRDIDAMVLAHRNHPSVVMWSIGNEMYERGAASGLRIAQELSSRIRELDPTRPVTAGVNGAGKNGDWTKFDPLFATLDVAGYNYELERHRADHERVPGRVIVVTESYQSETFAVWAACQDAPYLVGDFVWSGMDYLGEGGIGRVFKPGEPIVKHWEGDMWPWHGAACGDIDLTGWRKPISHYRAIVWDRGETLYAAVLEPSPTGEPWGLSPWTVAPALPSWTWPGQEGRELTVEVYSRHPSVRLYLGDRLVGEKPTTRAEQFKASFTVPYAPGELRAAGVREGKEVEAFVLRTAGKPAGIRLKTEETGLKGDGQDLAFVTVEVVDDEGRWVPHAEQDVAFELTGPATLAAIGNADLTTSESYQANPHRTYQGRALVVLRSRRGGSGEITLKARAEGLRADALTVRSSAW